MRRTHGPHRARLAVQSLEDRVVPALNLTIDGGADNSIANTNISTDTATIPGTTIFTPSATGAVLDVDAIEAALVNGNVQVNTGTTGVQAGNISWTWDAIPDDLDYGDAAVRTLTFRTGASPSSGNFVLNFAFMNFADNVDVVIDTTPGTPDGSVTFINGQINSARSTTITAGTGTVTLNTTDPNFPTQIITQTGNVQVTASSLLTPGSGDIISLIGNVTINAPTTFGTGDSLVIQAPNGIGTINQPVNGDGVLAFYGQNLILSAPVGAVTPLNAFTLAGGTLTNGANGISAGLIQVSINDPGVLIPAVLGTGTLTGAVFVSPLGTLAPGGLSSVGTLTINGDLEFVGGTYAVDLGSTNSDKIAVTGNVTIDPLSFLSPGSGVAGAGNIPIITFTGALIGAFENAPAVGSELVLGADAVTITNLGPAANGITVAAKAAAGGGVATGTEFDGTGFTAKLTGPGEIVTVQDVFGSIGLVTRNTTAKSTVSVGIKANASDAEVGFDWIQVNGALKGFNGKLTNVGDFEATGAVGSVTLGALFGRLALGGGAADKTTLTLDGSGFGSSITVPGVITTLKVKNSFQSNLAATAIGKAQIGRQLVGDFNTATPIVWTVPSGIGSLSAQNIGLLNVDTRFIGKLTVKAVDPVLSGFIISSQFNLSGNDGTAKQYGLKSMTVSGTVDNTTFNVKEGNVGKVTVGRFLNSNLYLDYTAGATLNGGGVFDSATAFTLESFTTTAVPAGSANNPDKWAFANSQIVADTIGKIKLSGVDTTNGGAATGIKFRSAGGSVQVLAADLPGLSLKTNLTPSGTVLAGDFFFLDAP